MEVAVESEKTVPRGTHTPVCPLDPSPKQSDLVTGPPVLLKEQSRAHVIMTQNSLCVIMKLLV